MSEEYSYGDGRFESVFLQRRVGSELGPDRDHNFVRTALYEAANVVLTRPVKGSTLKSWAMRLAARAGMRKAKVALARRQLKTDRERAEATENQRKEAAAEARIRFARIKSGVIGPISMRSLPA